MDNERLVGDLLHSHGLKKTPIRTEMLELFMESNFALSAMDLIAKMKSDQDRVTIYRALSSFEKHGILHKASEDGHGVKYAMCGHNCPEESHADTHAHFICNECHQTYCLDDVQVPKLNVSNEFSVKTANYTLNGICKECKDLLSPG